MSAGAGRAPMAGCLTALVLGACSTGPSAPPTGAPSPTRTDVVDSVASPAPEQRGDQVTVQGRVSWRTPRPGCVLLRTDGGQRFHLTGETAAGHARRAAAGEEPVVAQVLVTGYVPPAGATVCGARAFVTERVELVHG